MDPTQAAALTCGVSVVGLVAAEARGHQGARALCKTTASLAFVAASVAAGAAQAAHAPYGRLLLVAQGLGLVGDIALLGRGRRAFLAGLGSFLAGHVALVLALVGRWPTTLGPRHAVAAAAAALAAGAAVALWRWLQPHLAAGLRLPVRLYVVTISAMVVAAAGAVPPGPAAWQLPLPAALMFYLSDIAVARQRFVAPALANKAVGLPLYYAAQLLLGIAAGHCR